MNLPYTANATRMSRRKYRILSSAKLRKFDGQCNHLDQQGSRQTFDARGRAAPSCSMDGDSARDVHLLIGVLSAPRSLLMRDAIRRSWMQWEAVGQSVLACFVVGRQHVQPALLHQLDEEARQWHEMLFLHETADGCYLTVQKIVAWWRAAATLAATRLPALRYVAKVDEDSFVHLPNLEADLHRLSCAEARSAKAGGRTLASTASVYYGAGAFAGYHPTRYVMCGFSWRGDEAYHRYGCAKGGAHPPFPFVMGSLQVPPQLTLLHITVNLTLILDLPSPLLRCRCSAWPSYTSWPPLEQSTSSQHAPTHLSTTLGSQPTQPSPSTTTSCSGSGSIMRSAAAVGSPTSRTRL
jgi:hypothetical protein